MAATFEVYADKGNQWRWRLRHSNGNIVADSAEGYSTEANCLNGIESVRSNAPTAPVKKLVAP